MARGALVCLFFHVEGSLGDIESPGISGPDCSADGAPWSTELE